MISTRKTRLIHIHLLRNYESLSIRPFFRVIENVYIVWNANIESIPKYVRVVACATASACAFSPAPLSISAPEQYISAETHSGGVSDVTAFTSGVKCRVCRRKSRESRRKVAETPVGGSRGLVLCVESLLHGSLFRNMVWFWFFFVSW